MSIFITLSIILYFICHSCHSMNKCIDFHFHCFCLIIVFLLSLPAPLLFTPHRAAPSSLTLDCNSLFQALPDQHTKAEFLVVGLTKDNVSKACKELNQSYQSHCTSQCVSQEELNHLISVELDDIVNNVTSSGIQISKQGTDGLKVSGLTKGVNKFMELIRGALVRQVCSRFEWNRVIKICVLYSWLCLSIKQ